MNLFSLHCIYCVVCFTRTKVNDSASLNDCTTKNGQVNAVTMKDVVDACCNAKRESIDVNMEAATTVGNIKELTLYPALWLFGSGYSSYSGYYQCSCVTMNAFVGLLQICVVAAVDLVEYVVVLLSIQIRISFSW